MNENNISLKRVYAMLKIPFVITLIVLSILVVGTICVSVIAMLEPDGGKWLLFGGLIVWMVFFPSIISGILQVLFYIFCQRSYKKFKMGKVRIYGIISCIFWIVSNAYLAFFGLQWFFNDKAQNKVYFWGMISFVSVIYGVMALIMLIKNKVSK